MELRPCAQGYKAYVAVSNTAYSEGYLVVAFASMSSEDSSDAELWKTADGAQMQCLIRGNIIGMHALGSVQCGTLPQTPYIAAFVQQVINGHSKVIAKRVFNKADIISELPATE